MDKISSLLGLSQKAGKLCVGEEPVGTACRAKKAALVLTASDGAENSIRRAQHFAEAGKCLCLSLPLDKTALGEAIGRLPCTMLALLDIGFATSLARTLFALHPDWDESLLASLEQKAKRTLARRKEKRAHEKTLARKAQFPHAKPKHKK